MPTAPDYDLTKPSSVRLTPSQALKIATFIATAAVTIYNLWGIRQEFKESNADFAKAAEKVQAELSATNQRMLGMAAEIVDIRRDMALQQANATLELERATTARFVTIEGRINTMSEQIRELSKAP